MFLAEFTEFAEKGNNRLGFSCADEGQKLKARDCFSQSAQRAQRRAITDWVSAALKRANLATDAHRLTQTGLRFQLRPCKQ